MTVRCGTWSYKYNEHLQTAISTVITHTIIQRYIHSHILSTHAIYTTFHRQRFEPTCALSASNCTLFVMYEGYLVTDWTHAVPDILVVVQIFSNIENNMKHVWRQGIYGNRNFREKSLIASRQLVSRLAGAHRGNLCFSSWSHRRKRLCSTDVMNDCIF
jgi:hypothetical protein